MSHLNAAPETVSSLRAIRNFTGTWAVRYDRFDEESGSMTNDLKELIERARQIEMTPEQLGEQRRSFAYGNTHIENDRITREMVAALDKKLHSGE
jgi:hypothetical protein